MTATRARDAVGTRQRITLTARRHFAVRGYDRSTVRAIAADAGVSANLITRYFGGKPGLFRAATEVDLRIPDALQGPRAALGARIACHVVVRWEGQPGDDPLVTMMRAAMSDASAARYMAEFFRVQASVPLAGYLGDPDGPERAAAVGALIMGVVVQRYVLRAGPVADAGRAEFTDWLGNVLQRLLTGDEMPALGGS